MIQAQKDKIAATKKGVPQTKEHRQAISESRTRISSRQSRIIPQAERLPLAARMFTEGVHWSQIAAALGCRKYGSYQSGSCMVKRLLIQAGLRTA